jgi:hypothetical protein
MPKTDLGTIPHNKITFGGSIEVMIMYIECIWQSKVPLRAASFAWLTALGKIFTLDNLRKHHVLMFDQCCMCVREVGSL